MPTLPAFPSGRVRPIARSSRPSTRPDVPPAVTYMPALLLPEAAGSRSGNLVEPALRPALGMGAGGCEYAARHRITPAGVDS